MSHRLAAPAAALALGVSVIVTAAPAQAAASWQTLSTIEDARHQACKVPVSDGTAWRVRLRVVNRNDIWVKGPRHWSWTAAARRTGRGTAAAWRPATRPPARSARDAATGGS